MEYVRLRDRYDDGEPPILDDSQVWRIWAIHDIYLAQGVARVPPEKKRPSSLVISSEEVLEEMEKCAAQAVGHPNKVDLEKAETYMKSFSEKCQRYFV